MRVDQYNWQAIARKRLQVHANHCFKVWSQTSEGERWRKMRRKRRPSSYACGFFLPSWHHDLIDALSQDDEETAKHIMLSHLSSFVRS